MDFRDIDFDNFTEVMEKAFLGKDYSVVKEFIKLFTDIKHRVVNVDGNACVVTCDYNPFRLNFTLRNNIIIHLDFG